MTKIEWTVHAEAQLDEILRFYTRRNGSSQYSKRLKKEIWKILKIIRKNQCFGEQLLEQPNQRKISIGNFVLIYEVRKNIVYIDSIRDGRRDEE